MNGYIKQIILILLCMLSFGQHAMAESHWTCDISKYEYDMTVYFSVTFNGQKLNNLTGYEIAAFCGDECRGVGSWITVTKGSYGYLRVRSKLRSGEKINIRLWDGSQEITADATIDFEESKVSGMPSSPVGFTFSGKYTLTYKVDDVVYKSLPVIYGTAISAEAAPVKEGYKFSGWSGVPSTMPARDVVVTGSFSINIYKLTYKVDGTDYKKYSLQYGATIGDEDAPVKEGYNFSGWSTKPEKMPARDVIITGSFSKGNYKITYKVDGKETQTVYYDYGEAISVAAEPTKEGYKFSGWKYNGGSVPATMPASNIEVSGTFSIESYTLTYMVDGKKYKEATIPFGTSITAEVSPTKTGYSFSGWSEIPTTMPAKNVEITGSFTINQYKLTYKVDGSTMKSTDVAYGTAITTEAAPSKTGYSFSGWKYNGGSIPATMPANNVEILGTFSVISYTIKYMVDGKEYKAYTIPYGTEISPEVAPTKEGYTFSGWSAIPEKMPAQSVTVTGTFKSNAKKGDFNGDGIVNIIDVVQAVKALQTGGTITKDELNIIVSSVLEKE